MLANRKPLKSASGVLHLVTPGGRVFLDDAEIVLDQHGRRIRVGDTVRWRHNTVGGHQMERLDRIKRFYRQPFAKDPTAICIETLLFGHHWWTRKVNKSRAKVETW